MDGADAGPSLYDPAAPVDRKREAVARGDVPVAVYGLGKMGLPLAAVYAETTGSVTGVDIDPDVVEAVEAGDCPVTGEPGLPELVADQVERGRLAATTDGPAASAAATVHVLLVPTVLSDENEPDLTALESACGDVAAGLSAGDLVIVESTVPPGTCRDVVEPFLADESGLDSGEFGVAFCPERTSSGTALRDVRGEYPKVVGGVDDESARAATAVYDELSSNEVHVVADATTAEAVKVFEGVYRDVNIALANELARTGDDLGISVREAIATANALPVCDIHDPGPGVGGHCIPYYPYFLTSTVDDTMALVRTARQINDDMPAITVARLADELAARDDREDGESDPLEGASVLVLGLTYRPGVTETRASPGVDVVEVLRERDADVAACDPLVDPASYGARPVAIDDVATEAFDAVVLVTPHEAFDRIDWNALSPTIVFDGRDALSLEGSDHRVVTLGGERGDGPTAVDGERERGRAAADTGASRADGGRETRPESVREPGGASDV